MKNILNVVITAALIVTAANADTIITFDDPAQGGPSGDTLEFMGSIENTGTDPVYLNSDGLDLGGSDLFENDLFFSNVPISVDGGQTATGIEFFDITPEPGVTPGTFDGMYTLIGGVDGNAQDLLASATFSVTAQGPTTPEPSSLTFFAIGLGLMSLRLRRTI